MANICPLCHKYFNPPEDWKRAVCPKCFKDPDKPEPNLVVEEDDTEEWVVVFLAVDGPYELQRIVGRKKAEAYAQDVRKGKIKDKHYLKDSERIHVWRAEAFDNPKRGRTVIPVGTLDGIKAEDFDQSEYL